MSAYRPFTTKSTPKITYGNYLKGANEDITPAVANEEKRKRRLVPGVEESPVTSESDNATAELYKRRIPEVKQYQNTGATEPQTTGNGMLFDNSIIVDAFEGNHGAGEAGGEVNPPQDTAVYSEYLKNAIQEADNAKTQAYINAENAYQKALASYGSNAEALGRMGLTASGFSDYLTAQAYTANRTAEAIADADYNKAVREAKYQDYVKHQQEYQSLLADINNGTITSDGVDALKTQYNLNEDEVSALKDAADAYKNKMQGENYLAIIQETGTDLEQLQVLKELGKISDTDYDTEVGRIQKSNYQKYLEELKSDPTNFDFSVVEKDTVGDYYDDLRETASDYKPISSVDDSGMGCYDGDISIRELRSAVKTNSGIGIKLGGFEYRVKVEEETRLTPNTPLYSKLSQIKDRELFVYNNALYIKHGDSIFKLGENSDREGHWEKIKEIVGIR